MPRVDADLGLIERVFENLLGNALQHTPAGGVVAIRLARDDFGVAVAVSDTGAGIAADELPHIFDRHYRGAAARDAGAGLGLADHAAHPRAAWRRDHGRQRAGRR